MNHTRHYFGAYLRVETSAEEIEQIREYLEEGERLSIATPPSLFESGGVVILIPNIENDCTWLKIDYYHEASAEILDFPNWLEILAMINKFVALFGEEMDAIRRICTDSYTVVNVGYVMDKEY